MYLNGSAVISNIPATFGPGGADSFSVGAANAGVFPLSGKIDEIGIWNRILTAGEITQLYDSGNGQSYPFTLSHTITASAGSNGSISPSGAVSVSLSGSQTFTITPDSGYNVSDVLVDGVSVGVASSYTFSNVRANHTIAASFVVYHTITATSGLHGSISPSGAVNVSHGASQTFTLIPNVNYHSSSVVVDGVPTPVSGDSYTFTNVTTTHTISAAFSSYYVFVDKPTGTPYTNVNGMGREQYDQSDLLFDSPSTYYDGVDIGAYTNIPKPTGAGLTIYPGYATGLLIPFTYSTQHSVGDDYTYINKPTT